MAISVCSGRAWRFDLTNSRLTLNPEELLAKTSRLSRREVGRLAGHGADLDDLHQEAQLAVLAAAARFEENRQVQFDTYATNVVRRHLISCLRPLRHRYRTVPLDEDFDGEEIEDDAFTFERSRYTSGSVAKDSTGAFEPNGEFQIAVLQSAVRALSPRQREAIRLRFWEDLKLQEIAQSLGISTARAGALVQKGLEALRLILEPHREELC